MNLFENSEVYEEKEPNVNQTKDKELFFIRWHQRLGHLNFTSLRRYLSHHNIAYVDNTEGYVGNSFEKAKAIKRYNQTSQQRATGPYQYIHTDFVDPITLIDFGGER